jgi:hypothetical protein
LHEIGHGWFARRRGLEVIAIRVGFLHGSCEYEAPEYRRDEYVIAWSLGFQFSWQMPYSTSARWATWAPSSASSGT